MPTTIFTLNNQRLQPAAFPEDARLFNGKFGASKVFPTGCPIGRKTSDGFLYPCVNVSAIQTATPTGTATAGTFMISFQNSSGAIVTTTALAYNASIATIQAALDVANNNVANGVVASSAGSVAPFSTPSALILTFSGTGYAALEQPLVTVDWSLLVGTTAVAIAQVGPDSVKTITPTTAASAGHFVIEITRPTGVKGYTGPIAYNATLATIQTALDLASGVANGVVASSAGSAAPFSSPVALVLTYSGTGYTGIDQPNPAVQIGGDVVGTTKVTIDDTTITRDGTDVCVGFAEYGFVTDANSNCFLTTGTAQADLIATPSPTMPYFIAGTFNTTDIPGYRGKMLSDLGGRTLISGLIRIP